MRTHLIVIVLALGAVLGGRAQAAASSGGMMGPQARGADDDPTVDPDTVYVARLEPIEIIGQRLRQQEGTGRRGVTEAVASKGGASGPRARSKRRRTSSDQGVAIGGFVMNETFSVVGNDFYTAFYSAWSEPADATLYTVYVREEPSPQFGARLSVEVGDRTLFRTFLRPNNRKIQKAAQRAARRAHIYVKRYHEPREVY